MLILTRSYRWPLADGPGAAVLSSSPSLLQAAGAAAVQRGLMRAQSVHAWMDRTTGGLLRVQRVRHECSVVGILWCSAAVRRSFLGVPVGRRRSAVQPIDGTARHTSVYTL
jgi:hypothetical protein